jgi:protein required for attachment to host cells
MPKSKIYTGDWVIVADGRKAMFFANEGDEFYANLKTREVHEHEDSPSRDLGSDRPGRVHESATARRSAIEPQDLHEAAEETFLVTITERLDRLMEEGGPHGFIIVAPPRALGVLRKHYSDRLRANLRAEIDRDLTHLPVYEIEKHILASDFLTSA